MMEVCYFGTYEKNYPVNNIIIKGLRKNGIVVKECHISLWERYKDKHGKFLSIASLVLLAIKTAYAYCRLGARYVSKHKESDVVIIGYIGQLDVIFFRFLRYFLKKKPKIMFVPLVSLFDTAIIDRNLSGEKGIFSRLLFFLDKLSFKSADLIVLDTNEHIKYISELFGIDKNKFKRVWVGADEEFFYPIEKRRNNEKFTVLFFGKYIPLHGIEYIIEAAKMLENSGVIFKLVGNGQLYDKMLVYSKKMNVHNIDFTDWIEYNSLVREINGADVVLGIFGGSDKSFRVIPNKIFQAIACGKAVITGDSYAIRELFTDKKDIYLCKNKNAESIKSAILELKQNVGLKDKIARSGRLLFKNDLNSERIGKEVINYF